MLSYKEYLAEAVTDIVFHRTNIHAALKILTQNKFRLTSAIGTASDKEHNKNRYYFLSTARSPMSSYIARDPYAAEIYFTLDGRKLNQKFKGFAVDYWGPTFRQHHPDKHEMEDRIVSDEQYIENAISYIKEVHLLYSFKTTDYSLFDIKKEDPKVRETKVEDRFMGVIQQIYSFCKKNDIPIYLYENKKDYGNRNKNKAINILNLLKDRETFKQDKREPMSRWQLTKSEVDGWIEVLKFPIEKYELKDREDYEEKVLGKFSDQAKRIMTNYVLGWYKDDGLSQFKVMFHNNKSNDSIGKIIKVMRDMKINTPEELFETIYDKYKFIIKLNYRK